MLNPDQVRQNVGPDLDPNCLTLCHGKSFYLYFCDCLKFVADEITFANKLDPDQVRQNAGPDLDSNCLTL